MKPTQTKTYAVACFRARDGESVHDLDLSQVGMHGLKSTARSRRSVWVVRSSHPLDDLFESLARELDSDDRILVLECGPRATWVDLGPVIAEWFTARSFEPRDDVLATKGHLSPRSNQAVRLN